MSPYFRSVAHHFREPILKTEKKGKFEKSAFDWPLNLLITTKENLFTHLACLRIMIAVDVPLSLQEQILLKIMQQVRRRHGAAREEVRGHPTFLEIVRS